MENKKDTTTKREEKPCGMTDEEVESLFQVDEEEQAQLQKKSARNDLYSSIVLFLISLYVFIEGVRMPVSVYTGSDGAWYGAPGGFPVIIGGILMILSVMLFAKSWRITGGFRKDDFQDMTAVLRSAYVKRLALITVLLAVYIFVLLGRVPFYVATFLFLFVTMLVFRRNGFAVWKLLVISVVIDALITYGFGTLAGIPLP